MTAETRLITDGAKLEEIMRSPDGPLGRELFRRASIFQTMARATLAPHRKTGCLEDSIVKRFDTVDGKLAIRVTADTTGCATDYKGRPTRKSYALLVHEGTEPHVISMREGGPRLTFFWPHGPDGARIYSFVSVHHPGTKAIRFFSANLEVFANA